MRLAFCSGRPPLSTAVDSQAPRPVDLIGGVAVFAARLVAKPSGTDRARRSPRPTEAGVGFLQGGTSVPCRRPAAVQGWMFGCG